MKITICDFCHKPVEKGGIGFKKNGSIYRVDISVIKDSNGIRAVRTDACAKCTIKFALMAGKQQKEKD